MNMTFDSERVLADMENLMKGLVPHEDDFLFFKNICSNERQIKFLDVGANSGQSAISFLMVCPMSYVVSYEPNSIYMPVLEGVRRLLGPARFEYHMDGFSDKESNLDLFVPHVDGFAFLQEASLSLSQFQKPWVLDRLKSYGEKLEITPVRAHFVVADTVIEAADVVKIDAEGAEMSVLRGMNEIIRKSKPIFLIENNDWQAVTDFLAGFGYRPYQYNANSGQLVNMNGASVNCFYLLDDHFEDYGICLH